MLEVRQLSKVFFEQNDLRNPGLVALYNISLAIRKNEFVSLLGPSGCGKTTLIRIIAGLLPADRGEVMVNGKAVTAAGPDALKKKSPWICPARVGKEMLRRILALLDSAPISGNHSEGSHVRG